ncbi:MAG: M3 family oligoendopeptidase, partial [Pseudomonadota bacterium]
RLRDRMGRLLGHRGFAPLGYLLLARSYDATAVSRFREEIKEFVVPVAVELAKVRARRLGLDRLLFHDEAVCDPEGNPRPLGGPDYVVEQIGRMCSDLDPELAELFSLLVEHDLLDLEVRPGKAGGGFCAHFPDSGLPFIFANCNGSEADVRVLAHELGHAFQIWQSRSQPWLEFRLPTLEACEIHSLTMEYLAEPYAGYFFSPADAERYSRLRLEQVVQFLPYMAAVDHFQHEVYASPALSPAERNSLWRQLEREYLPWRDYGGLLPHFEAGALWQRQLHVYSMPFYYLDYALAETVALQLWTRARADRAGAMRDYLAICRLGGSRSFPDLLEQVALRSPFQRGCLATVVDEVRRTLGLGE